MIEVITVSGRVKMVHPIPGLKADILNSGATG